MNILRINNNRRGVEKKYSVLENLYLSEKSEEYTRIYKSSRSGCCLKTKISKLKKSSGGVMVKTLSCCFLFYFCWVILFIFFTPLFSISTSDFLFTIYFYTTLNWRIVLNFDRWKFLINCLFIILILYILNTRIMGKCMCFCVTNTEIDIAVRL